VFRRGTGAALPELPSWLRAPGGPDEPIAAELRQMLARITGRGELAGLPAGAPLFGEGVALDSLTGTLLLREVQRRFGVDVAGTDLNLDALATLGALASFIAEQRGS
jgi:acyl carrier protein